MSTTNTPAQAEFASQALIDAAGVTVSRSDLVAAAGHVLSAQRLITGDSVSTPDLALYRLIDMLGGDHNETLGKLANELLDAIEASTEEAAK
jgi:hypothetical protein